MIEILYKTPNAVVIYKPSGIPSQSDPSGDADAMTLTSEALAAEGEPRQLWLIHRLDRVVSGLIVFARNKKYAAILSELVKDRLFTKEYFAVVDGEAEGGVLSDLIYKDASAGKAFIVDRERKGVKDARLSYKLLASRSIDGRTKSLVYISLETGRFHQIRAQLSHRKLPITGDKKYGSRDAKARGIALMASHLSIDADGENVDVFRLPDITQYPWSLFSENEYNL